MEEAYELWKQAAMEFIKANAAYKAGNKKAGVQARKLSTVCAAHLKTWRAASVEHDKTQSVPKEAQASPEVGSQADVEYNF